MIDLISWFSWYSQNAIVIAAVVVVVVLISTHILSRSYDSACTLPEIPVANIDSRSRASVLWARIKFIIRGRQILAAALQRIPGKPFWLKAHFGDILIFPHECAHDLSAKNAFRFGPMVYRLFHADLPGLEGFQEISKTPNIVKQAIHASLKTVPVHIVEGMSDECLTALKTVFSPTTSDNDGEWRTIHLKPTILDIVNRTSARAFLGENLCRNEDWLRISATYTVNGMLSGPILHLCPSALRKALNWISPVGAKCRRQVEAARQLINPIIEQRRASLGKTDEEFDGTDAIDWIEKSSGNSMKAYDAAAAQLGLSFAATHTSSDLVTQTVLDLATHADQILFESLRTEINAALSHGHGWTPAALEDMKLLDSVIKESLRLKPMFTVSALGEVVNRGLTVEGNGIGEFHIPPGTMMAVSSGNLDASVYENPFQWDGRRFYDMRRTSSNGDTDKSALLVSTTPSHSGFGIGGIHACPGRFFAAALVKIVLCHLLVEFEWELDGTVPRVGAMGMALMADPKARLLFRRRR